MRSERRERRGPARARRSSGRAVRPARRSSAPASPTSQMPSSPRSSASPVRAGARAPRGRAGRRAGPAPRARRPRCAARFGRTTLAPRNAYSSGMIQACARQASATGSVIGLERAAARRPPRRTGRRRRSVQAVQTAARSVRSDCAVVGSRQGTPASSGRAAVGRAQAGRAHCRPAIGRRMITSSASRRQLVDLGGAALALVDDADVALVELAPERPRRPPRARPGRRRSTRRASSARCSPCGSVATCSNLLIGCSGDDTPDAVRPDPLPDHALDLARRRRGPSSRA